MVPISSLQLRQLGRQIWQHRVTATSMPCFSYSITTTMGSWTIMTLRRSRVMRLLHAVRAGISGIATITRVLANTTLLSPRAGLEPARSRTTADPAHATGNSPFPLHPAALDHSIYQPTE